MDNTYQRIFSLIGKTLDHQDVRQFLMDVGEKPVQQPPMYHLPKTGVTLGCTKGIIVLIHFHIDVPAGESRPYGQYRGQLYGGLEASDLREDVKRKLSRTPDRSVSDRSNGLTLSSDFYDLPDLQLNVSFDDASTKIFSVSLRRLTAAEMTVEPE